MRILFLCLLLAISLSSCTHIRELHTQTTLDPSAITMPMVSVLEKEGFWIKKKDADNCYLRGELHSTDGKIRTWIVQIYGSTVVAQAELATPTGIYNYSPTGAAIGQVYSKEYYNDEAPKDITWYWNVRNEFERICGGKIEFNDRYGL